MTARLPTPGADSGAWGDVLNTYLQVGHDATGRNIGALVETSKSAIYTLATTDNGTRIVVTAAVTITVPTVGQLWCRIIQSAVATMVALAKVLPRAKVASTSWGCFSRMDSQAPRLGKRTASRRACHCPSEKMADSASEKKKLAAAKVKITHPAA